MIIILNNLVFFSINIILLIKLILNFIKLQNNKNKNIIGDSLDNLNYLDKKNENHSLWDSIHPIEPNLDDTEVGKIEHEIDKLETELDDFQARIDQEVALTEKITETIKSRSSNPLDMNVLRDIELQWRTTHSNVENIQRMMQPRVDKIQSLKEKMIQEHKNLILRLKNECYDTVAMSITNINEGMEHIKNALSNIFQTQKTLIQVNKLESIKTYQPIVPNPVDIFDVFENVINNYLEQLKESIS